MAGTVACGTASEFASGSSFTIGPLISTEGARSTLAVVTAVFLRSEEHVSCDWSNEGLGCGTGNGEGGWGVLGEG